MKSLFDLAVYGIATFGLAYIVGHSYISQFARQFLFDKCGPVGRFIVVGLECPACFSFHVGLLTVAFNLQPSGVARSFWGALLWAFAMTGTSYILARLTDLIPAENLPQQGDGFVRVADSEEE